MQRWDVLDCSVLNFKKAQAKNRQKPVYQHFLSARARREKFVVDIYCLFQRSILFSWRYCIPAKSLSEFYQIFHFHLLWEWIRNNSMNIMQNRKKLDIFRILLQESRRKDRVGKSTRSNSNGMIDQEPQNSEFIVNFWAWKI